MAYMFFADTVSKAMKILYILLLQNGGKEGEGKVEDKYHRL